MNPKNQIRNILVRSKNQSELEGSWNCHLNGVPCQKNEDRLRLPKNCTDRTYGDTKKQYDPALSAKDPDQENDNEGARPVMWVWKLLQDPRGAEPPSVKSADNYASHDRR